MAWPMGSPASRTASATVNGGKRESWSGISARGLSTVGMRAMSSASNSMAARCSSVRFSPAMSNLNAFQRVRDRRRGWRVRNRTKPPVRASMLSPGVYQLSALLRGSQAAQGNAMRAPHPAERAHCASRIAAGLARAHVGAQRRATRRWIFVAPPSGSLPTTASNLGGDRGRHPSRHARAVPEPWRRTWQLLVRDGAAGDVAIDGAVSARIGGEVTRARARPPIGFSLERYQAMEISGRRRSNPDRDDRVIPSFTAAQPPRLPDFGACRDRQGASGSRNSWRKRRHRQLGIEFAMAL